MYESPALMLRDARRVGIDAHDGLAGVGEGDGERQADIAGADDGDASIL